MKIYCDKCHEDISKDVDFALEKYEIGKIKCEKCGYIQNRYISETDLQLYAGASELLYVLLTGIAALLYEYMGNRLWLIPLFILLLAGAFFLVKYISRYIYKNAPGKKKTANKIFNEDANRVKKSIQTQFTIFFILAFGALMWDTYRIECLGGMLIIAISSLAKYYVCTSNEKTTIIEEQIKKDDSK
ncbi:MAG: hypothetical protein Q4F12_01370 [Erysipelotrichaceae bacterium]|nr:hypothetical protein [Erysipelotrichaceae bacterium]